MRTAFRNPMATKIMSSSNHTQMLKIRIKLPKLASQQARVLSSCFSSSSSSTSYSSSYNQSLNSGKSSSSSPSSVLPQGFIESKKKRPLSPQPLLADQREVKKMKVVESSSATASSTPRMSPTELHEATLKIKFAKDIYEAQKQHLEKITTDPVKLRRELAELRRKELDLEARVEAQLREEKQMANLEAKRKQDKCANERESTESRIERQRRRGRNARDRMEAVAKSKLKQLYSCSLKEFGFMTQCDYACSWGIMGGQHPSPLELLGLRIKKQGDNHCDLREVELEEGEIVDELEGEIC